MSAQTVRERLGAIEDWISRFLTQYDIAVVNGTFSDISRLDTAIGSMESAKQVLMALVAPSAPARNLTLAERCHDVVIAVERIADATGAVLLKVDALHSQVVAHAPVESQGFWAGLHEAKVSGLLMNEPSVTAALKERGVLAWWFEPDRIWRIVNTRWLTAHADIRAYVMGAKRAGRACRFCRLVEPPTSPMLARVDGAAISPLDAINGATRVEPKMVMVHEQCAPFWEQWVSIANSYPSHEAAHAADEASGRVSRPVPPLPELPPAQPEPQPLDVPDDYPDGSTEP